MAGTGSAYSVAVVGRPGMTSYRTGEAAVIRTGVASLVCRTALGSVGPFFGRLGSRRVRGPNAVAESWASAGRATN